MNIEERLKETQTKIADTVARINALDQDRQNLLQEALRLDGEIRVLNELKGEQDVGR